MIRKYIKKLWSKPKVIWLNILSVLSREKIQTKKAIRILNKLVQNKNPTSEEIKFLKGQSLDLVKIVGLMGLGAVSIAIPIALEKSLNKFGISIMPKDQEIKKEDNEQKEEKEENT